MAVPRCGDGRAEWLLVIGSVPVRLRTSCYGVGSCWLLLFVVVTPLQELGGAPPEELTGLNSSRGRPGLGHHDRDRYVPPLVFRP